MGKVLNKAFITLNLLFIFIMLNNKSYALDKAVFAMGCFWCAESEFNEVNGVNNVIVGYAGGTIENPTYKNHPGYKEAIEVEFDSNIVSYNQLLDIFWRNVDPLDGGGQFCDRGSSYTSVVYYKNNDQKAAALDSKEKTLKFLKNKGFDDATIATEIIAYTNFYPAEEYHQDYKEKNPVRYRFYRWNCGRDARLGQIWG